MASPQISRRDFLALAGLTSASAGCPAMAQALKAKDPDAGLKTFQATCSMECLHCNLKAFEKRQSRKNQQCERFRRQTLRQRFVPY